jgi:hypothetical protein
VFRAAQPIYTAAPAFAGGAADPLPVRLALLPGEREAVEVPPAAALAPVRRVAPPAARTEQRGSRYADAALARAAEAIRRGEAGRHVVAVREALGMARLIRAGLLGESAVTRAFADALDVPSRNMAKGEAGNLVAWGLAHADDREPRRPAEAVR